MALRYAQIAQPERLPSFDELVICDSGSDVMRQLEGMDLIKERGRWQTHSDQSIVVASLNNILAVRRVGDVGIVDDPFCYEETGKTIEVGSGQLIAGTIIEARLGSKALEFIMEDYIYKHDEPANWSRTLITEGTLPIKIGLLRNDSLELQEIDLYGRTVSVV